MRRPIHVPGTDPAPSYTPAMAAGEFVFVSGQLGINHVTGVLEEGVEAQTARALENLAALLAAAGASLSDLVKTTVLVRRIEDGSAVAGVCNRYFPEPRPARSMYAVAALPRGALVEIEGIALAFAAGPVADPPRRS
jgi:2-iminobutanoate/2-iminopropanoate deaminase